jgi:isoamylase
LLLDAGIAPGTSFNPDLRHARDNEITWVHWDEADTDLLEFTRSVSALRAGHPVFRRRRFFDGRPVRRRGSKGVPDLSWFRPDGTEMSDEDWDSGFGKSVAVYLNGQGIPDRDVRGGRVTDDSFIVCFNAHHEPIEFTLPPEEFGASRLPIVDDTLSENGLPENDDAVKTDATVEVCPRSVMLLKATRHPHH